MSGQAIVWALRQKTGSPTRKLVLLLMADRAGGGDDEYGHGVDAASLAERLAPDVEASVEQVQRALDALEKRRLIRPDARTGRIVLEVTPR